ncbi:hypothetical protein [Gorillibacterium massiliense]|uniref:hypothetical protein n=1 Tax=Gorillibacterium massiliense TaxID=1280390 RepID=UPI0004BB3971|nr:hypothetical protein [Gorillibacterium massiliense]
MLNRNKLTTAYKKYNKNFADGAIFAQSKMEYEEIKSEIIDIVESNNVDKDHILLLDLGAIFSYYLSKWKEDVLVNGGQGIDGLKQMQITLFYQCVSQELYKVRYPDMMVDYTFKEIIATLIHFTMYGWEKEERVLFDFIADHLDEASISANDWNKHTWFLLELYLRFRNKTILGINEDVYVTVSEEFMECEVENDLIPEDLDIYGEVLERWTTPDEEEIAALISKMIIYHSERASELGKSIEFGDYRYGFYPYEILFLLHVRKKQGLPVPNQFNELLMNTPEANVVFEDPEPYPVSDPNLEQIVNFYRKNYPDYAPNKYEDELFQ